MAAWDMGMVSVGRRMTALVLALALVLPAGCCGSAGATTASSSRASSSRASSSTSTSLSTGAPTIVAASELPRVAATLSPILLPGLLPLDPVELWRLDYVFRAMEPLAQRWPWMTTQNTCVLLVALHAQWLLNCGDAPSAEFVRQPGEFRGYPIYARTQPDVSLGGQVMPVEAFVRAVPATADVPTADAADNALSRRNPFVVVASLETLSAAHQAFPPTTSTEEWMSLFVHEFFHTRQLLVPSFAATYRAMGDGTLDRGRLQQLFDEDVDYRDLVQREFELLADAASADISAAQARDALSRWWVAYAFRRAYLRELPDGAQLLRADAVFSYVEGVARYVEGTFLVDEAFHPHDAQPPDRRFGAFSAFEGRGYAGMLNRGIGSRYYYALGMHLALLLSRVDPSWTARVHQHPQLLIGEVQDLVATMPMRHALQ